MYANLPHTQEAIKRLQVRREESSTRSVRLANKFDSARSQSRIRNISAEGDFSIEIKEDSEGFLQAKRSENDMNTTKYEDHDIVESTLWQRLMVSLSSELTDSPPVSKNFANNCPEIEGAPRAIERVGRRQLCHSTRAA